MIHVILHYYNSKERHVSPYGLEDADIATNIKRNEELKYVLLKNIQNKYIDKLHVISNCELPIQDDKIIETRLSEDSRPSGGFILNYVNKNLPGEIVACTNTDVFFDDSIQYINFFKNWDHKAMCLRRWTNTNRTHPHKPFLITKDSPKDLQYGELGSIDTYVFRAPFIFNGDSYLMDFDWGDGGSDYRMMYFMEQEGYEYINPCYLIRHYHHHFSSKTKGWWRKFHHPELYGLTEHPLQNKKFQGKHPGDLDPSLHNNYFDLTNTPNIEYAV